MTKSVLFCIAAWPMVAAQAQAPVAESALESAQAALPANAEVDLEHGLDVLLGRAECQGDGNCVPCFQCHQLKGQGNAALEFPRLTGQTFRYLYDSLRDYAAGRRQNETMSPIARALTRRDMRDVAAFYSLQHTELYDMAARAQALSDATPETLMMGGALAAEGNAERGIQACVNCHGPKGGGLPPIYPYLAGQYAGYLEGQLEAWQSGKRGADTPLGIMEGIAKRLSDDEVFAVSRYYAAIRPPTLVQDENYAAPFETGAPLSPLEESSARARIVVP